MEEYLPFSQETIDLAFGKSFFCCIFLLKNGVFRFIFVSKKVKQYSFSSK